MSDEFTITPHRHCDCVHEALHGRYLWDSPDAGSSMWMGQDARVYRWERDVWATVPPADAYPMRRVRETGAVLQMSSILLAELEARDHAR